MSVHDFDITSGDANTGVAMRAAINAALQALASQNSGTTNPSITYPFQVRVDTSVSPNVVYWRKADNSAWVSVGYVTSGGLFVATPPAVALTDAATIATDASLGNTFAVTLAGNRTLGNPTNPVHGQKVIWRLKQDATGGRTITLDTAFRFGTDVTGITLSTAANKVDYMGAVYDSTDAKWDVIAFVKGY